MQRVSATTTALTSFRSLARAQTQQRQRQRGTAAGPITGQQRDHDSNVREASWSSSRTAASARVSRRAGNGGSDSISVRPACQRAGSVCLAAAHDALAAASAPRHTQAQPAACGPLAWPSPTLPCRGKKDAPLQHAPAERRGAVPRSFALGQRWAGKVLRCFGRCGRRGTAVPSREARSSHSTCCVGRWPSGCREDDGWPVRRGEIHRTLVKLVRWMCLSPSGFAMNFTAIMSVVHSRLS